MKNIFPILPFLMLFQSCIEKPNEGSTTDLIKKVETGLTTRVHITGDSTWSIEERMEHYGIPGASIAVIHEGKIAWAKGYGVMDKERNTPVTTQTLFQAAATSMPVTAYGALRLAESNDLSLDENINSYLKSWKVPENEFSQEAQVTIRNLLNHSAGIHPRGTGSYRQTEEIPTLLEILNGTPPASNEPITVNKVPGESVRFAYASYVPLQQLMLDVEDKDFPEIMRTYVLQPLAMDNSTYNQTLTTAQLEQAATGYLQDGSMVKNRRHLYPAMASNGLWTTAEDYAKFITHVQQSKALSALMGTPYDVQDTGWSFTLGLGFQLLNREGDIYFRHHGWNRGFYAEIAAHRDKGYGVVVLTNTTFPEFNAEVMRAVARAYNWSNYVPVHQKLDIDQTWVEEVTGRYQSDDEMVEVYQKDHQLFYKNILSEKGVELVKVSDSLFVRRNSSAFIQFKRDPENGTVHLQFLNRNDGATIFSLAKVASDQKSPIEFLLEGDYENGLMAYRNLKELDPSHPTVQEAFIDDIAYDFYHADRMTLALNTFKVNMRLYPDSYKVYEGYAEACEKAGDTDLAISNYSKSLELNPQNNRARNKLKALQEGE